MTATNQIAKKNARLAAFAVLINDALDRAGYVFEPLAIDFLGGDDHERLYTLRETEARHGRRSLVHIRMSHMSSFHKGAYSFEASTTGTSGLTRDDIANLHRDVGRVESALQSLARVAAIYNPDGEIIEVKLAATGTR